MALLNVLLNAPSDSYPTRLAIFATFKSPSRSNCAAQYMHQCVRYSSGDSPRTSLKRAAKLERDIPAVDASDATVHRLSTASCIALRADLNWPSPIPLSHPAPREPALPA